MTNSDISFLDEQFGLSLKKGDFETCRRLLIEIPSKSHSATDTNSLSYPIAFFNHYEKIYQDKLLKKKNKESDVALYNLFALLKKDAIIYNYIADCIINWHQTSNTEHDTRINILIKNQLVISLLKHTSQNQDFKYYAFTLFNDYVPEEIFSSPLVINSMAKKAIYAAGRKRNTKTDTIGDNDDEYAKFLKELETEMELREKSSTYSQSSKKQLYEKEFLPNRLRHLHSINFNVFKKLKEKAEKENLPYCNNTSIQRLWFNAAVVYFRAYLMRSDTGSTDNSFVQPKTNDPDELSVFNEKERIKTYALMLIPDRFKCLMISYSSNTFEDEKDAVARNTVKRWRTNLDIYYKAFSSFIEVSCKETLLEDYIEKDTVFFKYLYGITKACTLEADNTCFFCWKLLADKLIARHQSESKKPEYELLVMKYHLHNETGLIRSLFPALLIDSILNEWEAFKKDSYKRIHLSFRGFSSMEKYMIILSLNRGLENAAVISYFFQELNQEITDKDIESALNKWKNC